MKFSHCLVNFSIIAVRLSTGVKVDTEHTSCWAEKLLEATPETDKSEGLIRVYKLLGLGSFITISLIFSTTAALRLAMRLCAIVVSSNVFDCAKDDSTTTNQKSRSSR